MNKPVHYTSINLPENLQIISQRFLDENFIKQLIQILISNEDQDEKNVRIKFNKERILMFKVRETISIGIQLFFKGLLRNDGSALAEAFLNELDEQFRSLQEQNEEMFQQISSEIIVAILIGAKYWTLNMVRRDFHDEIMLLI